MSAEDPRGTDRPLTLCLAALGGQGGGVVSDWLVEAAQHEGWLVQATSVPGVAQRTGATIYYLELFSRAALPEGIERPVFALMPLPGDVDIVVATELVEAGRACERGFITPDRTALITSTHREYTISEKSHPGDGRTDASTVLQTVRAAARRCIALDMAEVAARSGGRLSAVVLGVLAGSGLLPFREEAFRAAIRASGIAVESNLAAFEAGLGAARRGEARAAQAPPAAAPAAAVSPPVQALFERIAAQFPPALHELLQHATRRLVDYQDVGYAREYLERCRECLALEPAPAASSEPRLTRVFARGLALWMSFEDTIRVADIKTRPERLAQARHHARARPGDVVRVTEFVRPRAEEICGTLPARLGARLLASPRARRVLARFTAGRQITTTNVSGYLLLRALAGLRRWRRGTLRFREEHARIARWWALIRQLAPLDYDRAVEVAEAQSLVKGYGDTHERGLAKFAAIASFAAAMPASPDGAERLRALRALAARDETGAETLRASRST